MNPQPNPSTQEDALRDARLVQALRHMPDAHLQPDAALGASVLQAAKQALHNTSAPTEAATKATPTPRHAKPRLSGWRWLFGHPGDRAPWAGALASVLITSLITVMWAGRDLPEAQPQGDTVSPPAAEGTRAAMTAAAPTPVAATTQEPLPAAPAPTPTAVPKPARAAEAAIPQPTLAAKTSPAPPTRSVDRHDVRVSIDGKTHTLATDRAMALLATLRALPTSTAADSDTLNRHDAPQDARERAGAISSSNNRILPEQRVAAVQFTVETATGERWDISEHQVRAGQGGEIRIHPLTHTQWMQLRRLIISTP